MPRLCSLLIAACCLLSIPMPVHATPLATPDLQDSAAEVRILAYDDTSRIGENTDANAASESESLTPLRAEFDTADSTTSLPGVSASWPSQGPGSALWLCALSGCAAVGIAAFRAKDGRFTDAIEGFTEG